MDKRVTLFNAFPGPLPAVQILNIGFTNYLYKFGIAVVITPVLYLVHAGVDRYRGHTLASAVADEAHPDTPQKHHAQQSA